MKEKWRYEDRNSSLYKNNSNLYTNAWRSDGFENSLGVCSIAVSCFVICTASPSLEALDSPRQCVSNNRTPSIPRREEDQMPALDEGTFPRVLRFTLAFYCRVCGSFEQQSGLCPLKNRAAQNGFPSRDRRFQRWEGNEFGASSVHAARCRRPSFHRWWVAKRAWCFTAIHSQRSLGWPLLPGPLLCTSKGVSRRSVVLSMGGVW